MVAIPARRATRGFTLLEVLCAIAVAGILLAAAVNGLRQLVQQARRLDAVGALLELHIAQERHHAHHGRYGTLAELRAADRSPAGHYRLAIASADAGAFAAEAIADGVQARDAQCRRFTLRVAGAQVTHSSGGDGDADNADAANRRCWRP